MPLAALKPRVMPLAFGALALGCAIEATGEEESPSSDEKHALVVVERSATAGSPDAVRAAAFAGFLRLPAELEPFAVLPIAGLSLELPEAGACKKLGPGAANVSSDQLVRTELLDAGEVTLAAGGRVTTLAPRAFPSAADTISGVVYTTRDRAADPLPVAAAYTVATTGSAALEPIAVDLHAPNALEGVNVASVPFADVASLPAGQALDIGWQPGASGDVVYVTVEGVAIANVCAFRDEDGHGSLPVSVLPAPGPAALSVHRMRAASFASVGLTRGELRFDFELTRAVTFD